MTPDGVVAVGKVSTTPDDFSVGFLPGSMPLPPSWGCPPLICSPRPTASRTAPRWGSTLWSPGRWPAPR
ncbi:MAG: hypothetical protein OXN95_10325 [bacterium]|nr:hypothetical protein [bacterium]